VIGRRAALLGGSIALLSARALARGRTMVGGRFSMSVPWPLAAIDPHRLDDATAAIVGDAIFDTLYAYEGGAIVPSLAESEPEADGETLRVTFRGGIKSALGRSIEARDAAASIARARSGAGRAWLVDVPAPRVDGRALVFAMKDAAKLMRALASPALAVVPPGFSSERPDGTGPFRYERRADGAALVRSPSAARAPAFLDEIVLRTAGDLSASLRRFESGADDVGWLGTGLHEPRKGAALFDAGAVAWAVLRTGKDAGSWNAPGVAQSLADGIPHARLSYLSLGPSWPSAPTATWGGAPADLLVRDDSPWLIELARAVAGTLSASSHEVTARLVPAQEIAQRRATRGFTLMIDVVRALAAGAAAQIAALATADDPSTAAQLARHPPRAELGARVLTRTMRIGVLGEIRIQGGRVPDLYLPSMPLGLDLGAATRRR
jgi:peptide/nickel transport system substrate-binding protein